jgi:hypothetical protein
MEAGDHLQGAVINIIVLKEKKLLLVICSFQNFKEKKILQEKNKTRTSTAP